MNEIININQNKVGRDVIQTVNARELHQYLGVGKDFSNWIKARINKYGFMVGEDYTTTDAKTGVRSNVLQREYHISLDMAKELSMTENNEQGRNARRYFIECERKLHTGVSTLDNPVILRAALLSYTEKVIQLEHQVEQNKEIISKQAPAVKFVERFVATGLNMCLRDAWKGLGLSPTVFTKQLVEDGILFRNNKGTIVHAKQSHIKAGHFVERLTEFGTQTLATPKGIEYISKKYENYIYYNSVDK